MELSRPDLDRRYALAPQVAVRPEPFGALLYHFGTRRLSFLKDPRLLAVVQGLADAADGPRRLRRRPGSSRRSWPATPGRWPRWPRRG